MDQDGLDNDWQSFLGDVKPVVKEEEDCAGMQEVTITLGSGNDLPSVHVKAVIPNIEVKEDNDCLSSLSVTDVKEELDLKMACEDASDIILPGDSVLTTSIPITKQEPVDDGIIVEIENIPLTSSGNDQETTAKTSRNKKKGEKELRVKLNKITDEEIAELVGGVSRTPRSCRAKVKSYADTPVAISIDDDDDDEVEYIAKKGRGRSSGGNRKSQAVIASKETIKQPQPNEIVNETTKQLQPIAISKETTKKPQATVNAKETTKRKKDDICTDLPSKKPKTAPKQKAVINDEIGSDEDAILNSKDDDDEDNDEDYDEEEEDEDDEDYNEDDDDEDFGAKKSKKNRKSSSFISSAKKSKKSNTGASNTTSATSASKSPVNDEDCEANKPDLIKDNPDYRVGKFVVRKKDVEVPSDTFPVWKIESGMLLHKFIPFVENGVLHHKATSSFNTLLYKTSEYMPLSVFEVSQGVVRVEEKYQPHLPDLEDDPLMKPFNIYLQILIGQVISPDHLNNVLESGDSYYLEPLNQIDDEIKEKLNGVEAKFEWSKTFKEYMEQRPTLQLCSKGPLKGKNMCQACPVHHPANRQHPAKTTVTLAGVVANSNNSSVELGSKEAREGNPMQYSICLEARWHLPLYHGLLHLKYHLLEKSASKVEQMASTGIAREYPLMAEKCTQDRPWVHERLRELKQLFNGCPELLQS